VFYCRNTSTSLSEVNKSYRTSRSYASDGKKTVSVFLTIMGSKTYELFRNLVAPQKPSEYKYEELVEVLNQHFSPAPLVIAERFHFHKLRYSEWAAPIVPVVKPDKSIRVCGDYKVTINSALEVDQHPLPNSEELFVALSGGEKFTKLDLSIRNY